MKHPSAKRVIGFLLAAIAASAALTVAERVGADDPKVQLEAGFEPAIARVGEATVLTIAAGIPSGYHLYSLTQIQDGPLRLQVKLPDDLPLEPLGEWHAPAPEIAFDPIFKKNVEYYSGKVELRRAFKLAGDVPDGAVKLTVRGQICNPKQCIIIKEKLEVSLALEAGDPRAERAAAPKLEGEAFPPDRPAPTGDAVGGAGGLPTDEGMVGFLIIAFLAGLGALLTPCVFPMIPITVSFFSKYAKVSLRRSVTMGAIYAIAIIVAFTLIGIIVSAIFGAVGMQTLSASWWFNLFLTALLVVFAFNLFGLFEINVPSGLIGKASAKEQELTAEDGSLPRQALGVVVMAFVFTAVSFTCTVGFIGLVLAEAAKGNWFYPALGMLVFAFAFALPFFFLAVFPSWADKLKGKGGDWMVAVKVVLGFLELAGALKFLSNVDLVLGWGLVTRPLVLTLWVGIFLAAGLFLLRVFNLPHSDTQTRNVGPIRMFFGVLLIALAGYSSTGIRDTRSMGGWLDGWLPPAVYPGQEAAADGGEDAGHLPWIVDDIDKGMAKAREEVKPLFVDFTGYTCTNCRYMEGAVFPRPEVRSRLERMVLVTAYTDGTDEVHDQQREYQIKRFETAALPFYAILNPFDDTVLAVHPDMTKDVSKYVEFLDEGLAAFDRVKPKDVQAAEPNGGGQEAQADAGAGHDADTAGEEKIPTDIAEAGAPVDFEFPELKGGKRIKLSSLRGKWVFVNFWASWCVPCRKELKQDFPPALAAAPQITLLTVAFDGDETRDAAIQFADDVKLWDHIVLQGGEDIEEAGLDERFEVSSSLPISYLIHPKGHIAWMRKGSVHKDLLIELFAKTRPAE